MPGFPQKLRQRHGVLFPKLRAIIPTTSLTFQILMLTTKRLGLPATPDHGTREIHVIGPDLATARLIDTTTALPSIVMVHDGHRVSPVQITLPFKQTETTSETLFPEIRREDLAPS